MSILYNCHTDGDHWRITKFNDGEVESSYLCSTDECQCPAGQRPSCRHRLMLPMFLSRGAVDSFWFLDFERKGWVSNEPVDLYKAGEILQKFQDDVDCERSGLGSQELLTPEEIEELPDGLEKDYQHSLQSIEPSTKPSWRRI